MKLIKFNVVLLGAILLASSGIAQTTLPGGSDVDGDFAVGNSTNKGGLTIAGQTGNAAAPGISVTGDGGMVFQGTHGTGSIPVAGVGSRLMWLPKKSAFRAGSFNADESIIGEYSSAFGGMASGDWAFAIGGSAIGDYSFSVFGSAHGEGSIAFAMGVAVGDFSIASGDMSSASGYGSVSVGIYTEAWGFASVGVGGGWAFDDFAFAGGHGYAAGFYSVAIGYGPTSIGDHSVALGSNNEAVGDYSVALGSYSVSEGVGAVVIGSNLQAKSANVFVIGRYNAVSISEQSASWVNTDPLFVVGNGSGVVSDAPEIRNRNAFAVYKNGKIKMDRQGDILMGEFGNPE